MKKFGFTKMVASGNDFIVFYHLPFTDYQLPILTRRICDRKYGVGADGLLALEKSKTADIRMRIFNADGSEAEMCGNGARCAALFAARRPLAPSEVEGPPAARRGKLKIETKAGVIQAQVRGGEVKIKLTDPKDLRLNIPIKINNRALKVNFINTGVPHTVVFVEGLEKIDVAGLGRQIRYHQRFKPAGTNVDFVQVRDKNSIQVRTYERGVEDETLACGTGAVASALITIYHLPFAIYHKMNVIARSKELLRVSFDKINGNFRNVWLEGSAKIVYQGEYHV